MKKETKEGIVNWWGQTSAHEWLEFAGTQKDKIVKEIDGLAKEILAKIADTPIFAHRDQLIHEAKQNLDGLLHHLQHSPLVEKVSHAIDTARHGKSGVLGFLNIPTQRDIQKLQRKLSKVEARLDALDKPSSQPPLSA